MFAKAGPNDYKDGCLPTLTATLWLGKGYSRKGRRRKALRRGSTPNAFDVGHHVGDHVGIEHVST